MHLPSLSSAHAALLILPLLLAGCLPDPDFPSSRPAPSTGATSASPSNPAAVETRIFAGVNAYRHSKGLAALSSQSTMTEHARAHAQSMAASNRLSHDGYRFRLDSLQASGFATASENVASSWGHADVAGNAVEKWRKSPGHHRNMTNARDNLAGVGVAFAKDGTTYTTMLYGR